LCGENSCCVNGGWGAWGSWGSCSQLGRKTRTRKCNNPTPLNGGASCAGSSTNQGLCPVNGMGRMGILGRMLQFGEKDKKKILQ